MVIPTCKKCQLCQKAKLTNQKYGKLPAKLAEENPWDTPCVDLAGPCKMERKGKKDLKLWCLTMIDPATGWFEMEQISNKTAAEVADICETTWFTRCPLPQRITPDRGTEFMAEIAKMVKNDYGLKLKPFTTRNPQANAIIERVHQTIGNIIRTFNVQSMDSDDPWTGMLAAAMFAERATNHTTLQASPIGEAAQVKATIEAAIKVEQVSGDLTLQRACITELLVGCYDKMYDYHLAKRKDKVLFRKSRDTVVEWAIATATAMAVESPVEG
jgi:hypothetical protein